MIIQDVMKKLFKRIKYNGKIYSRTDTHVIGGIAESLKNDAISTKSETKTMIREVRNSAVAYYEVSNEHFKWLIEQAEKVNGWEEERYALQEEIKQLKETLLFYANKENYIEPFWFKIDGEDIYDNSKVQKDEGKVARKVLRCTEQ